MIWHISDIIAVNIITLIFIPIVSIESIKNKLAVSADIKSISGKIIIRKIVVVTARLDLYGKAIIGKGVLIQIDPAARFHVKRGCVFCKNVS